MLAVHGVFRDVFGGAAGAAGAAGEGDTARAEELGSYYDNVLRFLEVHHEGEETLLWPKLRERCPDNDGPTLDLSAAQHESVIDTIATASGATARWRASADAADRDNLVAALTALDGMLVEHLNDEEATILPLCREHITQEEWGQLPGHGLGNFTGDKVWLILGLIREHMTQEQRDLMLANMPPPAVDMWTSMGERSFNEFIAGVRTNT
jgi:hypothetical protein